MPVPYFEGMRRSILARDVGDAGEPLHVLLRKLPARVVRESHQSWCLWGCCGRRSLLVRMEYEQEEDHRRKHRMPTF